MQKTSDSKFLNTNNARDMHIKSIQVASAGGSDQQ